MQHKVFQAVLVILLIVFTAAGLVLFVSPLTSLLLPTRASGAESSGIAAISGGMSDRVFNLIAIVVVLLFLAVVFLISRRRKLR